MNTVLDENRQTNDLGYYEIDAKTFRPMGDRILVTWEEKKDTLLDGRLVQADTHKKQHYTGIVRAIGPDVTVAVITGDRILFDQFSGFEKYFDSELGRMALISESAQGSAFAVIPYRTKIGSAQPDYNYDI